MLKKHEQLRIHGMLDAGMSVTNISSRTGWSLGTIYKYKRLGKQLAGNSGQIDSMPKELAPYEVFLDAEIKRQKMKPNELFYEIQSRGYTGKRKTFDTYTQQRKYVLRPKRTIQLIETAPGEQAQVDWAHFGTIDIDGVRQKVYLFVYILAYSRVTYAEFVVRQNQRTLQECHMHAFATVGIPKTILYDNMKTVVASNKRLADGSREVRYTPAFVHFARYYQFEPKACAPRDPQSKGKVERKIRQIRTQFSRLTPRMHVDLEELNARLCKWMDDTARNVVHGTTREKPYDMWLRENNHLSFPDNLPSYSSTPFQAYYTSQYGLFVRSGITYNLGSDYARKKIETHERQEHGLAYLDVYRQNNLISTVMVPTQRHGWVDAPGLKQLDKPVEAKAVRKKKRMAL